MTTNLRPLPYKMRASEKGEMNSGNFSPVFFYSEPAMLKQQDEGRWFHGKKHHPIGVATRISSGAEMR